MTTEPKLPEWDGDPAARKSDLRVGPYSAKIVPLGDNRWSAHVHTVNEGGYFDVTLLNTAPRGAIIGAATARALCELIIRQALRADAAEAKLTDLVVSTANLGTSAERAVLALLKRAQAAEAKVRQLAVQVHNLLPIEDVAAEVPAEDWDKLRAGACSIADVFEGARAGPADWGRIRLIARLIPDADWAKLLEARGEDESKKGGFGDES